MNKETGKFNNILTPKLSLRLSIPYTKDIRSTDRTISYKNIYDLDRLGIDGSQLKEGFQQLMDMNM